jgi:hypothetical protein
VKKAGLLLLGLGSPLMLALMLIGGAWAAVLFALIGLLFPAALVALSLPGGRGRFVVVGLGLLLGGTGAALLFLERGAPASDAASLLFGLPRATWLMLLGLGLAPLIFTCWAYAATFDSFGPGTEQLRRLESLRRCDDDDASR